jgi:NAD(P)-dependent dehydrogenase (short-subunit alcohol dehydrogenase family)
MLRDSRTLSRVRVQQLFDLTGRTALVTGGGRGIGRHVAVGLAEAGARVFVASRKRSVCEETAAAIRAAGGAADALEADVAEPADCERVVREVLAAGGRLDVLVNNAAMPMHKLATRVTPEDVEQTLRTNFLSPVWTTTAAIPALRRAGGGAIVNVSSFSALVVPPREGVYAASKAALDAWSEGLWLDLAGSGIHVALVHPGPIETEIWAKRQEQSGYTGKRWPAEDVATAIVQAIEKRRHQVMVPPRHPGLLAARVLRTLAPRLLRFGMARLDPVPADAFDLRS